MKMVFFGPPGVGKGTHAKKVSEKFNIPQISTGELFREEVKSGVGLGNKISEIMNRGDLVPDKLTIEMLKRRLEKEDCKNGFILDGFPRTKQQAKALDKIVNIDLVLNFQLSKESVLERLTGRWTCKNCEDVYNMKYIPPKQEGICDKCSGELYQRSDQTEKSIKKRLEIYEKDTKPVLDYYRNKSLVKDVNVEGEVKEVSKRIFGILNE